MNELQKMVQSSYKRARSHLRKFVGDGASEHIVKAYAIIDRSEASAGKKLPSEFTYQIIGSAYRGARASLGAEVQRAENDRSEGLRLDLSKAEKAERDAKRERAVISWWVR